MSAELRPPRRPVEKRRDFFPFAVGAMVIAVLAAVAYLQGHRSDESREPRARAEHASPRPAAAAPHDAPVAELPVQSAPSPAMDCGVVNGERRCFPRANDRDGSPELTAAERTRRALAIMEDSRRQYGSGASGSPRVNPILQTAENACGWIAEHGSIAYRQCRGRQWQRLRRGCIRERETGIYDGNYCDAERRFVVPA